MKTPRGVFLVWEEMNLFFRKSRKELKSTLDYYIYYNEISPLNFLAKMQNHIVLEDTISVVHTDGPLSPISYNINVCDVSVEICEPCLICLRTKFGEINISQIEHIYESKDTINKHYIVEYGYFDGEKIRLKICAKKNF